MLVTGCWGASESSPSLAGQVVVGSREEKGKELCLALWNCALDPEYGVCP